MWARCSQSRIDIRLEREWIYPTDDDAERRPDAGRAAAIVTRTDIGKLRVHEDAVAASQHAGWIVLADGMGGYRGEMMRRIVVRDLRCLRAGLRVPPGEGDSISEVLCEAVLGKPGDPARGDAAASASRAWARPSSRQLIDGRVGAGMSAIPASLLFLPTGCSAQLTRDHSLCCRSGSTRGA